VPLFVLYIVTGKVWFFIGFQTTTHNNYNNTTKTHFLIN
jgi:hypothetical protein